MFAWVSIYCDYDSMAHSWFLSGSHLHPRSVSFQICCIILFRPNGRLRILYFLTPLLLVMGYFGYPSTLLTTWQLFKVLNSFKLLNMNMFCGCCYNFIHSMITYQYFYVQKHDSRNLRKVSDMFECCNLGKVSFEHILWMSFLLPEYTNGSFRKHISFFLLLWNLKRERERSYEMRAECQ